MPRHHNKTNTGKDVEPLPSLLPGLALSAYLAGKDVSECGKGVIERLVVDGFVQVLDEDVADTAFPQ